MSEEDVERVFAHLPADMLARLKEVRRLSKEFIDVIERWKRGEIVNVEDLGVRKERGPADWLAGQWALPSVAQRKANSRVFGFSDFQRECLGRDVVTPLPFDVLDYNATTTIAVEMAWYYNEFRQWRHEQWRIMSLPPVSVPRELLPDVGTLDRRATGHLQGWMLYFRVYMQKGKKTHIITSNRSVCPMMPPRYPTLPLMHYDTHAGLYEEWWVPQFHRDDAPHRAFIPPLYFRPLRSTEDPDLWYFQTHDDADLDIAFYRIRDWLRDFIAVAPGLWMLGPTLRKSVVTWTASARDDWSYAIARRGTVEGIQLNEMRLWDDMEHARDTLLLAGDFLRTGRGTSLDIRMALTDFQRSMLDLRGWRCYCDVLGQGHELVPKMGSSAQDADRVVQRYRGVFLRGVFTTTQESADRYLAYNVPVWHVTPYSKALWEELCDKEKLGTVKYMRKLDYSGTFAECGSLELALRPEPVPAQPAYRRFLGAVADEAMLWAARPATLRPGFTMATKDEEMIDIGDPFLDYGSDDGRETGPSEHAAELVESRAEEGQDDDVAASVTRAAAGAESDLSEPAVRSFADTLATTTEMTGAQHPQSEDDAGQSDAEMGEASSPSSEQRVDGRTSVPPRDAMEAGGAPGAESHVSKPPRPSYADDTPPRTGMTGAQHPQSEDDAGQSDAEMGEASSPSSEQRVDGRTSVPPRDAMEEDRVVIRDGRWSPSAELDFRAAMLEYGSSEDDDEDGGDGGTAISYVENLAKESAKRKAVGKDVEPPSKRKRHWNTARAKDEVGLDEHSTPTNMHLVGEGGDRPLQWQKGPAWLPSPPYRLQVLLLKTDMSLTRQLLATAGAQAVVPKSLFDSGNDGRSSLPPLSFFLRAFIGDEGHGRTTVETAMLALYRWMMFRDYLLHVMVTESTEPLTLLSRKMWLRLLKDKDGYKEWPKIVKALGLEAFDYRELERTGEASGGGETTTHDAREGTVDSSSVLSKFKRLSDFIDGSTPVNFNGITLPPYEPGCTSWLSDEWRGYIIFELAEMEFRHKLFQLDHLIRLSHPEVESLNRDSVGKRFHKVAACWGGGGLTVDVDEENWLVSKDFAKRRTALGHLTDIVREWPGATDVPEAGSIEQLSASGASDINDPQFVALESRTWKAYMQVFWDYTRGKPVLPFESAVFPGA